MSSTIIKKILLGDKDAVLGFYSEYSPRLRNYLRKKLPNNEDAEDILQEVFIDAIDAIGLLQRDENVQAWLYKIASNNVVDFYRKRKIKSLLLSQIPALKIISSEIHEPEFIYERNKIEERVERAFLLLSNPHRKALQLHYIEEVPVKEMAPIFNLSFKAMESLLYRARIGFQKAYERA